MTSSERLETRWSTPVGRQVLQRVLQDLRNEGGLSLPAILEELEGTSEVRDGLDLRFVPLVGQQLDEVNLYAVDLTGANLGRSRLQKADVRDALLTGANLEGADLRGAYLSNTDLTGANLRGALLDGAMLDGATLTNANLTGASCRDTFLSGASLDGADLRQAVLTAADFSGATCRGMTVSAGALDRATVQPPDRAGIVVESARPPARVSQQVRRAPLSQAVRRPGEGAPRPPAGPGAAPRVTGQHRASPAARPNGPLPNGPLPGGPSRFTARQPSGPHARPVHGGAERDWDLALARLIPMRRAVSRISVWVDGEEQVLYESDPH
ncbi:MAG: pentapeptide repeat-containing protein [Planctomycetes bacterium]|nr:pentapeptide repeat-containing protein [Planctomycetota bacterium]